jgi:hypothetical protein
MMSFIIITIAITTISRLLGGLDDEVQVVSSVGLLDSTSGGVL